MPNPLIKWAKRNTHSNPPHPLGAKRFKQPLSFPHSHPQGKEGGKKYLFSDTGKMPDIVSSPFKVHSPARTPYEEFWNSEHLHVPHPPFFFVPWDVAGNDQT